MRAPDGRAVLTQRLDRSGRRARGGLAPAVHGAPDGFLIGSDTWMNERRASYGEAIAGYRGWLAQLPKEAAEQIARKNGERLFGSR